MFHMCIKWAHKCNSFGPIKSNAMPNILSVLLVFVYVGVFFFGIKFFVASNIYGKFSLLLNFIIGFDLHINSLLISLQSFSCSCSSFPISSFFFFAFFTFRSLLSCLLYTFSVSDRCNDCSMLCYVVSKVKVFRVEYIYSKFLFSFVSCSLKHEPRNLVYIFRY